jgi:hypothetical protein
MGIYFDHGVVYNVVLESGKTITVVSTKQADERLLRSDFYQKQKEKWFDCYTSYPPRKLPQIDAAEFALSKDETSKLQSVLSVHEGYVREHGWFEVNLMSDTYGL